MENSEMLKSTSADHHQKHTGDTGAGTSCVPELHHHGIGCPASLGPSGKWIPPSLGSSATPRKVSGTPSSEIQLGILVVGLNTHSQSTKPRDPTDPQPSPALPSPLTQLFMWETETPLRDLQTLRF